GKKPAEDDDPKDPEQKGGPGGQIEEKTVSTTDPDCGVFIKGEHERQFAYEAHTACDKRGVVLGVEVTAGNVHDSVAWDKLYNDLAAAFAEMEALVMDAAYTTPWIARQILKDARIPVLPYTRSHINKDRFKPWDYHYDAEHDQLIYPLRVCF